MNKLGNDALWSGCHGVRLEGELVDVGVSSGEPLTTATVRYGAVADPTGTRLWAQEGVAGALFRRDDGRLVLASPRSAALEVDPATATITLASGDPAIQRQLLASFGVPLLLHERDVLLVHGSAAARGDAAIVVCADSGSGKSSALVRLIDDGWRALSEDLCVIDLRDGTRPRLLPGPPWVRVAHGESGPRDAPVAFASLDKTAWDLAALRATVPVPLARVVLLDAPGGDAVLREDMSHADALRALARHAVWLLDSGERGRRLFEPVAKVASNVPATRVRLPRRDGWRDAVPESLGVT
jgi:hypothetical protein